MSQGSVSASIQTLCTSQSDLAVLSDCHLQHGLALKAKLSPRFSGVISRERHSDEKRLSNALCAQGALRR